MRRHIANSICARVLGISTIIGFGMAAARADIFISDYQNDVVDHYSSSGIFINSSAITGPAGVALGPNGYLYVATASPSDGFGAEIDAFNPATGAQVGGPFASHVSDNNMNNPAGIAFGPGGNLYVTDITGGSVLVYNQSGTNVGTLTSPSLNAPTSITLDLAGDFYVSDVNNGNILKYSGGNFSQVNSAFGALGTAHDVGLGLDGNLYVLNNSGASEGVYRLNPNTGASQEIVDYSTSTFNPNDLAIGPDGKIYVSGQDNGNGEIWDMGTDGSNPTLFLNMGFNTDPTYMSIPEPSLFALLSIAGPAVAWAVRRKKRMSLALRP